MVDDTALELCIDFSVSLICLCILVVTSNIQARHLYLQCLVDGAAEHLQLLDMASNTVLVIPNEMINESRHYQIILVCYVSCWLWIFFQHILQLIEPCLIW